LEKGFRGNQKENPSGTYVPAPLIGSQVITIRKGDWFASGIKKSK
jgi:hypothetical protein